MKLRNRWLLGSSGLLMSLLWLAPTANAQAQGRYMTREGVVSFFSSSIMEDIEARTQQTAAVLDLQTRQLAFSIPIKSFQFKRTLMQEHFNENYMESEKFPKASFTGKLLTLDMDALRKGGPLPVTAEGDLTIHGVTRHVQVPGTLELQSGRLLVHSFFSVAPAEYGIEIPALVRDHIAKTVSVKVTLACDVAGLQAVSRP